MEKILLKLVFIIKHFTQNRPMIHQSIPFQLASHGCRTPVGGIIDLYFFCTPLSYL